MKFKKLIPLFLVLVLIIQFLPIQRIAAWLSCRDRFQRSASWPGQLNRRCYLHEKDPAILLSFFNCGQPLLTPSLNKFHGDETLLIRDADDILTPPQTITFPRYFFN